jgi:hypothetical protein
MSHPGFHISYWTSEEVASNIPDRPKTEGKFVFRFGSAIRYEIILEDRF